MSDVLVTERGATRWFRPSDYGANTGAKHLDQRRVEPRDPGKYRRDYEERRDKRRYPNGKPGQPGYKPRNPRVPKPLPLPPKVSPFVKRIPKTFGNAIERGLKDPRLRLEYRTALDKLGRYSPLWRAFDNVAMLADTLATDQYQPPILSPGFDLCRDCLKGGFNVGVFFSTASTSGVGPCWGRTALCLDGQNFSNPASIPFVAQPNHKSFYLAWKYQPAGLSEKISHRRLYVRPPGSTAPVTVNPAVAWPDLAIGFMPNPNIQREMLSEPLPQPQPAPNGNVAPPVPPYVGVEFQPGRPPRPVTPGPRRPPGRGEKHNKNTGSAAAAVALFKALDGVSEAAEIVDALYDALPKAVRDKWDRKGRGLVDQAGQYGIDGADWKIQALWYNWEKVDGDQALKNIINNSLQDKVHGGLHKHLPRNTGSALDGAFQGIEKGLGEFVYL